MGMVAHFYFSVEGTLRDKRDLSEVAINGYPNHLFVSFLSFMSHVLLV